MGAAIDHRGERGADDESTCAGGATWVSGTEPDGDRSPAVGAASLLLGLSIGGLGAWAWTGSMAAGSSGRP